MSDTVKLTIYEKIAEAVKAIRTANDYKTDAGTNVFKAIRPGLSVPSICVIPQVETIVRTAYKTDEHRFPLRFEGIIEIDETVDELRAYKIGESLLSDIVICVGAISWTDTDPQVDAIKWTSGGVPDFPESREGVVGVVAEFEVVYSTRINDPFNQ